MAQNNSSIINKALLKAFENPTFKHIEALYDNPSIKAMEQALNNPEIKATEPVFNNPMIKAAANICAKAVPIVVPSFTFVDSIGFNHFAKLASQVSFSEKVEEEVTRAYRQITSYLQRSEEAAYFSEFAWCIFDDELKETIYSLEKPTQQEIDESVIRFYTADSYERLKLLTKRWEICPLFEGRMKIILSCLNNVGMLDELALYDMAIPALLAQTDGLLTDIYKLIPKKIREYIKEQKKDKKERNHKSDIIAAFLKLLPPGMVVEAKTYTNDILSDLTFRDGRNIDSIDATKYSKNRNAILHGDKRFIQYGTSKNFIQSLLEIELIYCIYLIIAHEIKKIEEQKEVS